MKLRLLIAVTDLDYSNHLSNVLTKSYGNDFELAMCSTSASLEDILQKRAFDIALFSSDLAGARTTGRVKLPVILYGDETTPVEGENSAQMIRKYQRISSLVSTVLELYAKMDGSGRGISSSMGHVTVVWSLYGGCGKTTVALAYATCQCLKGKKATYLDLEPFSSTEYFFGEDARSMSVVFENLETNVELMLKSIEKQDESSGVFYYGGPNNYDDINACFRSYR